MKVSRAKSHKQRPLGSKFKCWTEVPQVIPQPSPADKDISQVSDLWQGHCPLMPLDTRASPAAHQAPDWVAPGLQGLGLEGLQLWLPKGQAHRGPTTQCHQLLISCLYIRPSLEGLLIVKPQDTPTTLAGEPLLSCFILPTFCYKRRCWLRPAFLGR